MNGEGWILQHRVETIAFHRRREETQKRIGNGEDENQETGSDETLHGEHAGLEACGKIAAEEVYNIGVVGQGPASMGVRVVKDTMGNIPSRMYNSPDGKTPGISRPATFYWKN